MDKNEAPKTQKMSILLSGAGYCRWMHFLCTFTTPGDPLRRLHRPLPQLGPKMVTRPVTPVSTTGAGSAPPPPQECPSSLGIPAMGLYGLLTAVLALYSTYKGHLSPSRTSLLATVLTLEVPLPAVQRPSPYGPSFYTYVTIMIKNQIDLRGI